MDNKYILLLDELNKHGIEKPYNVSPFMQSHFERPKYSGDLTIWKEGTEAPAIIFLEQLRQSGYILYENNLHDSITQIKLKKNNEIELDKWFDNTDFNIAVALKGLEFLNNSKLSQSNFSVNDASHNQLQNADNFK